MPGGTNTDIDQGNTSRRISSTAALHSSLSRKQSESTFTPKPMWRCSSRETLCIPSLNPGIVPDLVK